MISVCKINIVVALILMDYSVWAQQVKYSFTRVQSSHTMAHTMSAAEDADGFLWFGRVDGLYRFDGNSFTVFLPDPDDSTSVTHGRPQHLAKGKSRDLYVGTIGGGLSRYDTQTNSFETFAHKKSDSSTIAGSVIGGIYVESDSIVWVGSNDWALNRVNRFTKHVQRYYAERLNVDSNPDDHLGRIAIDQLHDSILWVVAPYGLLKFNTIERRFTDRFLMEIDGRPFKRNFTPIYADNSGYVWIGAKEALIRIHPPTRQITTIDTRSREFYTIRETNLVAEINKLTDSTLIVQTHSDGTIIINRRDLNITHIHDDIDIGKYSKICLVDRHGFLWLQDQQALITGRPINHRVHHINFRSVQGQNWSQDFLPVKNKNQLYIATMWGAGLLFVDFDEKVYQAYPISPKAAHGRDVHMRGLAWAVDSTIFIASDSGLFHFDRESKLLKMIIDDAVIIEGEDVTAVCVCDTSVFMAIRNRGVFRLVESNQGYGVVDSFAMTGSINKMHCKKEGLWLASSDGLSVLDIAPHKEKINPQDIRYLIPDIHVTDLYIHGDTIWASTYGQGLYEYDVSKKDWVRFNLKLGGGSNLIYHFTRDTKGEFWLNTDGGRVRLNRKTGEKINYREMGLGKRSPIIQLPNRMLITGGFSSVGYFYPEVFDDRGIAPVLYLKAIHIANRQQTTKINPNEVKVISLSPGEKELVFEFGAINYNPISWNSYRYRLIGRDTSWIDLGRQSYITLSNLNPGNYILELQAISAQGLPSTHKKRVQIEVEPSLYQIGYIQLIAGLMFLGIIYWIYLRQRIVRRRKVYNDAVEYFAKSRYGQNSVDEILWDVARNVISRLQFEDCVVYIYDEGSKSFMQKAAYGIKNPAGREILNPMRIALGEGIVGAAAKSKSTVIVDNVTQDDRYIRDLDLNGSEIAVPILHQNRVIGVIDSEHPKKGFFSSSHADVLSRIARECAHKIVAAQAAEDLANKEVALLGIQKEIAESKLTALQAQMNPHFIFNSLNSINWYILKNKTAEASIYLTKFSKLVRLILDNSHKLSIPLDEELKTLKLYLDLEAMRFDHTFTFDIQTDDAIDMEEVFVPPLILQPFVENAIWHGLIPKNEKGKLIIQVFLDDDSIKCVVQDDGIGRRASQRMKSGQPVEHQSKGLKLTKDRINILMDDNSEGNIVRIIDLVDHEGYPLGTRVEICLPNDDELSSR